MLQPTKSRIVQATMHAATCHVKNCAPHVRGGKVWFTLHLILNAILNILCLLINARVVSNIT